MKTICAWCGKVTLDGPEETHSHGICEECEKIFQDEFRGYRPEPKKFRHEPEEIRHSFVEEHIMFSLIIGSIFMVILLASAGLHYITGGYVPDLLRWLVDLPLK